MLSTRIPSGASLAVVRIAAVLILGLLALDLADAGCDPLVPAREIAVTTSPNGDADPCSEVCIDDCFCCSSSVAAVRPAPISEPAPTQMMAAPGNARSSPGFALPLDHVPLDTD